MGGLEQVGRAEAADVGVIVTPACAFVGVRHDHLALDQGAQARLLERLAAALAVLDRLGHDREPFGFLRQQFADCQRLGRQHPCLVGIGGLVMLGFANDGRTRDDHAVDTDRYGTGEATAGRVRCCGGLRRAHGVHSAG
jgi:hypothetical protein